MPTYAVVTHANVQAVTAAVRAGRTGGFVIPGTSGSSVLFDAPPGRSASVKRLWRPAVALAQSTGTPAWMLVAHQEYAAAVLLVDGPVGLLEWVEGGEPPADPAEHLSFRTAWDAHCAELAAAFGTPERAPALAAIHNNASGPVSGLLRRLCRVLELPDVAVGRSMLAHEEPGVFDARRVDAAGFSGLWAAVTKRFAA